MFREVTSPAARAQVEGPPGSFAVPFALPKKLPWPAVVSLLGRGQERKKRSTVALVEAFEYEDDNSHDIVRVPCSYITDFASIPFFLLWFIQPFGRHARAAILHDWLYVIGQPRKRSYADKILLAAMKELEVDWLKRQVIYWGVRLGGWIAYGHLQKEWDNTWANWRTGDHIPPPFRRELFYNGDWPDNTVLTECAKTALLI